MTNQSFLFYQLYKIQCLLGEAINSASVIRGTILSQTEVNKTALADIDQLVNILNELLVVFADIVIIASGEPKQSFEKLEPENFEKNNQIIAKITESVGKTLPQRNLPILPKGNSFSILIFTLKNEVFLAKSIWEGGELTSPKQKIFQDSIKNFFEITENFLETLGRWLNLLLGQKEYLWSEPKKPENNEEDKEKI